jgi:hypothetical protein
MATNNKAVYYCANEDLSAEELYFRDVSVCFIVEDVIQKSKNTGAISERCQIQSGSGIRALDFQSAGARIGESYSTTIKRICGIATSKLVAISS